MERIPSLANSYHDHCRNLQSGYGDYSYNGITIINASHASSIIRPQIVQASRCRSTIARKKSFVNRLAFNLASWAFGLPSVCAARSPDLRLLRRREESSTRLDVLVTSSLTITKLLIVGGFQIICDRGGERQIRGSESGEGRGKVANECQRRLKRRVGKCSLILPALFSLNKRVRIGPAVACAL